MRRLLPLLLMTVVVALSLSADKTRRRHIKVKPEITVSPAAITAPSTTDTICCGLDSLISRSGYDKPLHSRVETIFITNRLDRPLTHLSLSIIYRDMQGRQLHRATRQLDCNIPPGETRMLTFSSWDRQMSFYYHRSRPPKRSPGTPFDISTTVVSAVVTSGSH